MTTGIADDFGAGAIGRDGASRAGTGVADDARSFTAGIDAEGGAGREGTGVCVCDFGGVEPEPARGASKPSLVFAGSRLGDSARPSGDAVIAAPSEGRAVTIDRGDGVVSSRRGAGPADGGLGKPGADSSSSVMTVGGFPPSASVASARAAATRRAASSSGGMTAVLVLGRSPGLLPSAVCAISSSSARTFVAPRTPARRRPPHPSGTASAWEEAACLDRRTSLPPRFGSPSSASCTGSGATFVGVSVNSGGLVVVSPARCGACFAFSARMRSSTVWLPSASRSNRTPMPGAIAGRDGSFSRVHTTVPSPPISGEASLS